MKIIIRYFKKRVDLKSLYFMHIRVCMVFPKVYFSVLNFIRFKVKLKHLQ